MEYTEGILFIGTPHCGSGLAEWAVIGSKFLKYFRRVNEPTLEVLQQRSEVMERIRQDFHTMLRGRDQGKGKKIGIACFYEELRIQTVGEVSQVEGSKERTNANSHKIVPKASAVLDRYTSIGIHANHMNMTKFSSDQDPDYRNVRAELKRFTGPDSYPPKKASHSASSVQNETDSRGHTITDYKANGHSNTWIGESFEGTMSRHDFAGYPEIRPSG